MTQKTSSREFTESRPGQKLSKFWVFPWALCIVGCKSGKGVEKHELKLRNYLQIQQKLSKYIKSSNIKFHYEGH